MAVYSAVLAPDSIFDNYMYDVAWAFAGVVHSDVHYFKQLLLHCQGAIHWLAIVCDDSKYVTAQLGLHNWATWCAGLLMLPSAQTRQGTPTSSVAHV